MIEKIYDEIMARMDFVEGLKAKLEEKKRDLMRLNPKVPEHLVDSIMKGEVLAVEKMSREIKCAHDRFLYGVYVMKNLDLVVCCDTVISHLAGALGVPVWVALPFVPHWPWLLGRDDSPWYPTARLFRQTWWGEWNEVFTRMAAALEAEIASARTAEAFRIPVSPGELIDKIAILEIKTERISDPAKHINVRSELEALLEVRDGAVRPSAELARLTSELKAVNENLWQIEDDIRQCEWQKDFGQRFIELARSVYLNNDRRSDLKRQINELLKSKYVEEKSYAPYG